MTSGGCTGDCVSNRNPAGLAFATSSLSFSFVALCNHHAVAALEK